MPKPRLEDSIDALNALRDAGLTEASRAKLIEYLGDANSHVVAKAAMVVMELQAADLWQQVAGAFARFMREPLKTDKQCRAKTQIAQTLYELGAAADVVFLTGIRHVQMEPVFGGKEDTAALLRGYCALGLVRMGHPDVMLELADLLTDKTHQARVFAARGLGYSQDPAGVPLLRYKASIGDVEPAVTAECLSALLKSQGARSLGFVETFLYGKCQETAELAALMIGEARVEGSFEVLVSWFEKTLDSGARKTAMVAIASLRQDKATDFLINQVSKASTQTAEDAVSALAIYRHDPNVKARVDRAVESRR